MLLGCVLKLQCWSSRLVKDVGICCSMFYHLKHTACYIFDIIPFAFVFRGI